ncbi:phosphate ABC transporter permease PstA [Desulfoplanes formicivorans]|uniref:Phosphate transport system permease protein PstA n=1 Tax=Desulfoplanes formicivorans TaxID=1592317 RepID=A0A194AML5_9BACT|nr:phosphate ABC transporter permease PstA [Desulfoplanes formicivorans]GAU09869.1 phosphate ABC transporter permease [Desulfoplanes formicivorans]
MNPFVYRACTFMSWLCTLILVLVIGYLLGFLAFKGGPTINTSLFFGDTPIWDALTGRLPVWDGIWPACVGTLLLVGLAAATAIPLGVGAGIYLGEYAQGNGKRILAFLVDLLAGTPSILMGLLGFAAILFVRRLFDLQARTSLLTASLCVGFLVLPYIVRATQTALESVPGDLRTTALALGMTRSQAIIHVMLPRAATGIASGIILAVGRAAEDTAVILLTGVVANAGVPHGLTDKFEALPFHIFYLAAEYQNQDELAQAFGTALILLCLTSILFMATGLISNRLEKQ